MASEQVIQQSHTDNNSNVLIGDAQTKHQKHEPVTISDKHSSDCHQNEQTSQRIYASQTTTKHSLCDHSKHNSNSRDQQHDITGLNAHQSDSTSATSRSYTISKDQSNDSHRAKAGSRVWSIVRQVVMNRLKSLRDSWIQLAGHKGCFLKGSTPDTILKRLSGQEENCFNKLQCDELAKFVPEVKRKVMQDGEAFLEMQDLLACFDSASVMDVKMGCRTYLEDELNSALKDQKMRSDMYDKMIEIDQNEPTPEERKLKAVTKPRYMVWREAISSSANLGFRIEGMRLGDGTVDKEFKTIKTEEQVAEALIRFTQSNTKVRKLYLNRLIDLKNALEKSKFFSTHELIGSSLLFVHDQIDANIWLIDFAKTHTLPNDIKITHSSKWEIGNHEDGYMIGIDNLIKIFEQICEVSKSTINNKDLDSITFVQSNLMTIAPEHRGTNKIAISNNNNNNIIKSHQHLYSAPHQGAASGQTSCQ